MPRGSACREPQAANKADTGKGSGRKREVRTSCDSHTEVGTGFRHCGASGNAWGSGMAQLTFPVSVCGDQGGLSLISWVQLRLQQLIANPQQQQEEQELLPASLPHR